MFKWMSREFVVNDILRCYAKVSCIWYAEILIKGQRKNNFTIFRRTVTNVWFYTSSQRANEYL